MKKVVNIQAFVNNEMENKNYNGNQEQFIGDGEGLPTSNDNGKSSKRKKPNLAGFKYLKGLIDLNPNKLGDSEECDEEYLEKDLESKVSNFSNFQMENDEERDNDKENINKRASKYSGMTKAKKIVKTFLTKRIQEVM